MADNMEGRRKRNKRRYGGFQPPGKRWRSGRELEPGMQGILITCNMREHTCKAEAYNLLSEYADQLYGPEQYVELNADCDEDDMEAALQREMEQIHWPANRLRRFAVLDSGANNVLFVRTHDIDPGELVHFIMEDLYSTQKLKSRVILRMLPVFGSCRAFPEEMLDFLSWFLQPWFLSPKRSSYQISYKSRNNSHIKRDDMIKSIAGVINWLNPKNKVNLTNPALTVIVEVIKSVCCVSVVRDYKRFRKYNLQEVTKGPATPGTSQPEGAKDPATPGTSQQEDAKDPATPGTSQQEDAKDPATPGTSQQEDAKDPATPGTSQQEGAKDSATPVTSQREGAEDSATLEMSQQEGAEDSATLGMSQQESAEDSATLGTSQQEGTKDPATLGTSQQKGAEDLATPGTSQQEVDMDSTPNEVVE